MLRVENFENRILRWRAMAVVCAVLAVTTAGAETSASHVSRYDLRVWLTDDGLPQNSVNAIAQTPDGYLWVGTREGLARFDGVRFTGWDKQAAPQLRTAFIMALCVTRDGSLWIASESNGVIRLKEGAVTQFLKADGLPDNQIQCLLESRDGSLWLGGETGLGRFQDGSFKTFTASEMVHNNSIKALHEDERGILRVATVTGLVSVNSDGVVSTNNFGIGLVTNVLKAVRVDQQGRLWVGAKDDGLIGLTGEKRGNYAVYETFPENITTVIHEDHAGQLWVGSYAGLTRRVNSHLAPWWVGKTGVDDVVYTIYEDRERSLWVGGRDGLYRLSPARIVSLTMQDGLGGNNVVSVLEDRAGAMWFGLWGNGVTRLHDGEFSTITRSNGLTDDNVLSLRESRAGSLWVGMDFPSAGGVNQLGGTRSNTFVAPEGLFAAPVRVIYEDANGTTWIGTGKGLNAIRDGKMKGYTTTNGLAGNNITVIYEDGQTNLWIGTDGGLSRWTGTRFDNLTTEDGLSQNYINALYEDAAKEMWIGTRGGGLNRLKAGKLTSYTTKQGLFNDDVYEILEDDSGHLWMSCRRGLFRVSRSQFDDFDQGRIPQINCTTFGREDGLATVQCNGVAKPAGWKSRDGRLWFATIRGVVAVEARIKINERPPMVALEEIIVDGRITPLAGLVPSRGGPIIIPPGAGRVEIFYTGLSLQAAEKNRFKYRLQGVDEDWVDAGHQRAVTYNNIPPGRRYRFQVIACNNDGVWNELGAELSLYVAPHFWQTWWFKLGLVVLPIGLLALFYRARVARVRELENLRIRIAADLHDDVGSRLTKVAMVTELADRETPGGAPGKPHIQNITRTVRDITRAMDEIVWTINPRNDTVENLANYIFHYAQEYFQDTGVRCRLDLPPDLPHQRISTEERHHLFMAVKEALNNILKHAAATEVRIGLALTDDDVMIEINDNGRGIAVGRPDPTGEGLSNMRDRLGKIGGEFKLRSKSDGTTITLRLRRRQTRFRT